MTKLETKHILQAQVCDWINAKNERETSVASLNQPNQARWNRTVLKFGSENQLNVHNSVVSMQSGAHGKV